ncbi:MAG: GNAT family N-acetyltransferase [Streptosporangiales bacterium]|nr:GNAT family N-acetyltransferase [Streptosporangiales bacterium]MBO0889707.1 GNAT family N-acetyltransferase [Acidothermales bacterium]
MLVRTLTPDDWRLARDTRIAAVTEAPDAFASDLAGQLALTEADWRAHLTRAAGIRAVAEVDGAVAGLVGGYVHDGAGEIIWMWVDPRYRGRRVGEALVAHVAAWSREQGLPCVLWVVEDNKPAIRLYERLGFVPTGGRQPVPGDPSRVEFQMALPDR